MDSNYVQKHAGVPFNTVKKEFRQFLNSKMAQKMKYESLIH